mmetsp:Transcript_36446/g.100378  ORF Transcript_36446/g.100378 Transcript_36446/m.100378 type:complete len:304 (-) Transcript_36446:295-1206(-)
MELVDPIANAENQHHGDAAAKPSVPHHEQMPRCERQAPLPVQSIFRAFFDAIRQDTQRTNSESAADQTEHHHEAPKVEAIARGVNETDAHEKEHGHISQRSHLLQEERAQQLALERQVRHRIRTHEHSIEEHCDDSRHADDVLRQGVGEETRKEYEEDLQRRRVAHVGMAQYKYVDEAQAQAQADRAEEELEDAQRNVLGEVEHRLISEVVDGRLVQHVEKHNGNCVVDDRFPHDHYAEERFHVEVCICRESGHWVDCRDEGSISKCDPRLRNAMEVAGCQNQERHHEHANDSAQNRKYENVG